MHITQIASYYPPHLGGMEQSVKEISRRLALRGHHVDVFTSTIGAGKSRVERKKNLRISYLRSVEYAHTPLIFSLFFRLLRIPKDTILHLHVAQAYTPEIVCLAALLRTIPYVAHIHLDVDPSGPLGMLLAPYKRIVLGPVLRRAKHIICLSEQQKKSIGEKYRIPQRNISIIPNGVHDDFFLTKHGSKKTPPVILFVGRLSPQKNVPLLLRAVSMLRNEVRVEIVGEGEQREMIEALVRDLRLKQVTLVGTQTGKDLLARYAQADMLVMPSRKEGLPFVLLEAMAAGLPIIASDISGVNETLKDAGILIPDPRPETLAEAIDRLLENSNLRKTLAQKARRRAEHYRWDASIAKLEDLYANIRKT